ncbi:hypothetical protein AFLA_002191 [Aspergillus flavus NRRL3357]|nr:hypothetical protein AFLA_002191 [Aspergillus flavus NRRL3357]
MPRNLTFYPTVAFPLRAAGFGAPAPRHGQTWGVGRTSTRNFRKAWLWLRFACKLRIGHCFEIHCITIDLQEDNTYSYADLGLGPESNLPCSPTLRHPSISSQYTLVCTVTYNKQ